MPISPLLLLAPSNGKRYQNQREYRDEKNYAGYVKLPKRRLDDMAGTVHLVEALDSSELSSSFCTVAGDHEYRDKR